ncbi:MAG: ActS/PrrB/RegB family redox-sensitive histidine kinase [Hyphomicrobiales bacterium]|nr:ActS/PrrB/RegB family redox-sensitive histidine kinase [Hyphomicrobiales bacterium]
MAGLLTKALGASARRLRVETLVRLRWLAIAGQLAAVLFVRYALDFDLPLWWCLSAIAASAALNIGLRLRFARNHRLDDAPAAGLLAFDILQLSALLFMTGGLANPFVILALAPIVISAVSLPRAKTYALVALAVALAFALAFRHLPLPWAGAPPVLPPAYIAGVFIAFALSAVFVTLYASRVAVEARELADALSATELVLAREQHLTQLDGLAAAAAHELGTPLATIALVSKELARNADKPPAREDIDLLNQQARRCREILGTLTSLSNDSDGILERMSIAHLVAEVVEPLRPFGVELVHTCEGQKPEPCCLRSPGVIYGLGNIIENAVDFAQERVDVRAFWNEKIVCVEVTDDGEGFAPDILARLGEPYVTTRSSGERRAKTEDSPGLGLGLFIAKTLLERSGARVRLGNRAERSGARVAIEWQRPLFERDATDRDT